MAETYAIVESGGKQYRAEKGTELVVDRLPDDEGAKVSLRAVMFRADRDVVLNGGELEKVKVEAKVAEHLRGRKLRVFKYKPKKGYRRRAGHRSELTKLEVTEVKMLSRKPAAKAESKPPAKPKAESKAEAGAEAESKAKAESKSTATRRPAAKKAAGAGTAAKKATPAKSSGSTAAKKPAAKKPAAKKPAAKKPAAKKASTGKSSSTRKTSEKKQD